MYYRFTSYGYEGEKDYLEGGEKVTWSFDFPTLEDALEKKRHFEAWAKVNHIPPYEISIDEIETIVDEPEHIKIYINTQLTLLGLDPSLAPAIIAFGPYLTYANNPKFKHMVQTTDMIREGVASTLGVSSKRVDQLIKKLVENGIFIPIYREVEKNGVVKRTKKRGIYFVNPWVVAKGSWNNIKKLQQNIEFVKNSSSYCIQNETGELKIQINLPDRL